MELVVGDEEGSKWSELPILLLWMIEDRLSVADNLRFAVVCKNWLSAFKSCYNMRNFQGKSTMLWFMLFDKISSNKREFISILDGKRLTLEYPEFTNTYVISLCQGWFLFMQWKLSVCSVFLFNPFTGAKAELPDMVEMISEPNNGVFSITISGAPDYVILSECGQAEDYFALWIAKPGAQSWKKYILNGGGLRIRHLFSKIFLVGSLVYYFDGVEQLVVFDVDSHVWSVYQRTKEINGCRESNIVEYKGEIVKVCRFEIGYKPYKGFINTYRFMRLTLNCNDKSVGWIEIKDEEIEDTLWFMHCTATFVAKDRGITVQSGLDCREIKVGGEWVKKYLSSPRCSTCPMSRYYFCIG